MVYQYLFRFGLVIGLFFCFFSGAWGQSPGGVPNSKFKLWLKGGSINLSVGTYSIDWPDKSLISSNSNNSANNSNNNHATYQGGNTYDLSNSINNNKVVGFSGDDYFSIPLDIRGVSNDIDIFVVYQLKTTSQELYGNGDNIEVESHRIKAGQNSGPSIINYAGGNPINSVTLSHTFFKQTGGATNSSFININNRDSTIFTKVGSNSTMDSFYLGKISASSTTLLNADVAEVLVCKTGLTLKERQQIYSYLAIKYGITLPNFSYVLIEPNAVRINIWEKDATYKHNITGIATYDDSRLNQVKSKSEETGALLLLEKSNLPSNNKLPGNSALVFANNGLSVTNTTSFQSADDFFIKGERMERVWKCQKRGDLSAFNDFDITLDMSSLPSGFTANNTVLLVADDDNFTQNLSAYALDGAGKATNVKLVNVINPLVFSNYTYDQNVQYFTYARMDAALWVKANNYINNNLGVKLLDNILGINNMSSINSKKPNFVATNSSAFNFNDYIEFNQTQGQTQTHIKFLEAANFTGFDATESSVFMVARRDNNNTPAGEALLSYAVTGISGPTGSNPSANEIVITNPPGLIFSIEENSVTSGGQSTNFNITSDRPHIITNIRGGGSNSITSLDGNGAGVGTSYNNNQTIGANGSLIFGQEQDVVGAGFNSTQEYQGDLAEAIIFNKRLNNNDKQIVESYLAVKYGVTLEHDYYLSDGTTIWDYTANVSYNHDIAGIGRDDHIGLNQPQSKSQNDNTFVTMIGTNPNDKSCLIWGNDAAIYDDFTQYNSSLEVTVSGRIWKIEKTASVGTVTVQMEVPASLINRANLSPVLLVSNTPTFASGNTANVYQGQENNGVITFNLVTFTGSQYFTLGIEDDFSYTNNDTGAPNLFEACSGSSVTFSYSQLTNNPTSVVLNNRTGGTISISSFSLGNQSISTGHSGDITFTIPSTAVSGDVQFMYNNVLLYKKSNFIIHNPVVDFYPAQSPICASDSVVLNGVPAGGIYSVDTTIYPNLLSNSSLLGAEADWSSQNDIAKTIAVTYTYTPTYTDGSSCLQGISTHKNIEIRDNRLSLMEYNNIFTQTVIPTYIDNKKLENTIGSTGETFRDIQPSFSSGNIPFSFSFSGTYIIQDTFLSETSGLGSFPVTFSYNNGGCIAQKTTDIDVLASSNIRFMGLPTKICRDAAAISFQMDTLYAHSSSSGTNLVNNCITSDTTREYNRITSVSSLPSLSYTFTPSSNLATAQIIPSSSFYNLTFDVHSVNATDTIIDISIHYSDYKTIKYYNSTPCLTSLTGIPSPSSIITTRQDRIARHQIQITERPTIVMPIIDSIYCQNNSSVALNGRPYFVDSTSTYYSIREGNGLTYTGSHAILSDSIFDITSHYNTFVPTANHHLPIRLIYTIDRYGCTDSDTTYTQIVAPVTINIIKAPNYCTSDTMVTINTGTSGLGGSGFFDSIVGLDTTNVGYAIFNPRQAGAGSHPIQFTFTDNFTCKKTVHDSLIVKTPPNIQLELDGGRTSFCTNEDSILLETKLGSLVLWDTLVSYIGPSITDSIFHPNTVYNNGTGGGLTKISVQYSDIFNCIGYDTVNVRIDSIPILSIDSSFNGRDYISLGITTDTFNHQYCHEADSFHLNHLTPVPSSGMYFNITGAGIVQRGTDYYYDPSIVPDSVHLDRILYEYRDSFGCSNEIATIIRVDSTPRVELALVDTFYCINNSSVIARGTPDTLYRRFSYGGSLGIDRITGEFNPLLSGIGRKRLSYNFVDSNSCEGTAYLMVNVKGLPTPLFTVNKTQYCTADINDTLISNNLDRPGFTSYSFWGNLIIDSMGILDPGADTTGTQVIYYSYTDTLGCTNMDSVNVFVNLSPHITISGLDSSYCFRGNRDNISVFPANGNLSSSAAGFSQSNNNIIFNPNQDTAGYKKLIYTYIDFQTACTDTLKTRTYVHKPSINGFSGLDTFYCEIPQMSYPLTPLDSNGIFLGAGILRNINSYSFSPVTARAGIHQITYSVLDTLYNLMGANDTLTCQTDTIQQVNIRALPVPRVLFPVNNKRFCSTDTIVLFSIGTIPPVKDVFLSLDGGVKADSFFRRDTTNLTPLTITIVLDSVVYSFNPRTADIGSNAVTYIAENQYGCTDSSFYTYWVDAFQPLQLTVDSVYCESADSIALFAIPGGGKFVLNGDSILSIAPYYNPNPSYVSTNQNSTIGSVKVDTLVYSVSYGACTDSLTKLITVNPVPQLYLEGPSISNFYCLSTDTIQFDTISPLGGTLVGPGVLYGRNDVMLHIAGTGEHIVYYNYTDSVTTCSNEITDTFIIVGQPKVSFEAIGGCQSDSILFRPNNQILGLNSVIDSITSVYWDFEGQGLDTVHNSSTTNIDSSTYIYTNPGVYYPQLIVRNRNYCADTTRVRLVVSPRIGAYPYDESFENSHGNWYAEGRDSNALLWEWGVDSNNYGIAAAPNKQWQTNLNLAYTGNEDAWVYSPCFDLSNLERPMIKLDYWSDSRRSIDGAVLEYQKADGTWLPLGDVDRGINWFNTAVITGQPGDQTVAPIGWSGQSLKWTDARYKLDEFVDTLNGTLRLRMAFGSPSINLAPNAYYDGFAFDNVWIGSRSRNVLLESTSNITASNMIGINNHVYQLAFHSKINRDVILIQYNCCGIGDEFYSHNQAVSNTIGYYTGGSNAGNSYIDGHSPVIPYSSNLRPIDFEEDMLESPKFSINIDTFYTTGQQAEIQVTVTAKEAMPLDLYHINTMITEDSLTYTGTGMMIQAVARKNDDAANNYYRSWQTGDVQTVNFSWNYGVAGVRYNPSHFQAVVFVQNNSNHEVYQAATSRNVSGYWVGVNQVEGAADLLELNSMNLYPNPAESYFQVAFEEELQKSYHWKLLDIRGVEIQSGQLERGQQLIEVSSEEIPTGVYIFVVQNDKVFSQKKVIINHR